MVIGPVFQYFFSWIAVLSPPAAYPLLLATYPLQQTLWAFRSSLGFLAEESLAAVYFGIMGVLLGLILKLLAKRKTES